MNFTNAQQPRPVRPTRHGFTLVEILIVLVIIAILMALIFPIFGRVRENARQASCASNLHQIYMAVKMYRDDEKEYPASLAILLPSTKGDEAKTLNNTSDVAYIDDATTDSDYQCADATCPNPDGTGFLKAGTDVLTCPNDDTPEGEPRSSYGDISTAITEPTAYEQDGDKTDWGRYVWNYYGYNDDGTAFQTRDEAQDFIDDNPTLVDELLAKPDKPYNPDPNDDPPTVNPLKYSLSNRNAPPGTIITHCVYHRPQTSNLDTSDPEALYDPANAQAAAGAKDIILRLDGAAKPRNVAGFQSNGNQWQKQ